MSKRKQVDTLHKKDFNDFDDNYDITMIHHILKNVVKK